MACFRPLQAWQLESGTISFVERGNVLRVLTLPCGRCIGCRLTRQRAWALRCLHEAQLHDVNSFITLTYDDKHCPVSLVYKDFQRFMYRVRRSLGPTRFFACGEYGDLHLRPHFHAILFGRTFSDALPCGVDLYTSRRLEALWPVGFSTFGAVTYQSAAYVAGYALKKVTGPDSDKHYLAVDWRTGELVQRLPELARMSLNPGIGYGWFQKFWPEVYLARDGCVLKGGQMIPAPRYYDRLLERLDYALLDEKLVERYHKAGAFAADNTPARLAVREHCARARLLARDGA